MPLQRAWRRLEQSRESLRRRLLEWADNATLRNAAQRVLRAADAPLRASLFNAEQMRTHARLLASSHKPLQRSSNRRQALLLLKRLADNRQLLRAVFYLLSQPLESGRRMTPAAEWLLDNNHLIDDQIALARDHLPPGYVRELPWVEGGATGGCPRVYEMALAVVAHGDGRIDLHTLAEFVAEYQSVVTLKLGELWAIPIMLRLALIENLRRVAALSAADRLHRNLADAWAQRFVDTAAADAKDIILVVADMARSAPPLNSAFVSELARRLQGQGAALALPLTWADQQLNSRGLSIEQMIQAESQRQAANQLSISNSIGSLRLLGATDWREFVESVSTVEQRLRHSGDDTYAQMDFGTRDHYRHVVERIARQAKRSESEVIDTLLQLNRNAARHVGYWLLGAGMLELERAMYARPNLYTRLSRAARRHALLSYLLPIMVIGVGVPWWWLWQLHDQPLSLAIVIALALAGVSMMSQVGVDLVNWLTTLLVRPQRLPRLDFEQGIPASLRTLVVVPTLMTQRQQITELIEALEVRYLGNHDPHIHFALLTDWPDATQPLLEGEPELLDFAQHHIEQLNRRHAAAAGDRFFLLHRPRRWNAAENIWMGRERKRGKLGDLNQLLRDGKTDGFERIVGNLLALQAVKYVITLDTDTELPRDTARQLISIMAHPMNHPVLSESLARVTQGYGILQPRVSVSAPRTRSTVYARLFGAVTGIDPYTRAVSDVYQDVFAEGSFIGKGIYDVDAFETTLRDRLPVNRILSHDLLEGCYARSGLASDVQLYEAYPQRYLSDVSRRHRWIRGDWQIARWLLPWAPTAQGFNAQAPTAQGFNAQAPTAQGFNAQAPTAQARAQATHLSGLSRWKIYDNLRRSLVTPALLGVLLLSWFALPWPWAWFGSAWVVGALALPGLLRVLNALVCWRSENSWREYLRSLATALTQGALQTLFALSCLPFEAWSSLDAILRSLYRITISHRKLLEWRVSQEVEQTHDLELGGVLRRMWCAPAVAVTLTFLLLMFKPQSLSAAATLLLLWLMAPSIVWYSSRTPHDRRTDLTAEQLAFLGQCARITWRYFASLVNQANNFLPPDNFQEQPRPVVAARTSPTNIGLSLLANLTAYDLTYISCDELLDRTEATCNAMQKLERYRGHFYNWYSTETLQLLNPHYISTVDSGNLVAHLHILRSGLLALPDKLFLTRKVQRGIGDSLAVLLHEMPAVTEQDAIDELRQHCQLTSHTVSQYHHWLQQCLSKLDAVAQTQASTQQAAATQQAWIEMAQQCRAQLADLAIHAPWLGIALPMQLMASLPASDLGMSLRQLANGCATLTYLTRAIDAADNTHAEAGWSQPLQLAIARSIDVARRRLARIERLVEQVAGFASADFNLLYDRSRHLFSIGYNVSEHRCDAGVYDLLASEARLATYVAIAENQVPQDAWFALSRKLAVTSQGPTLVSWSGSMFEYLMPLLVMPEFPDTLLYQSCRNAVHRQIQYGHERGVAWGISESGYTTRDASDNYQYRAFGVPGLGLMRGLADDLVIAPYASALALLVLPQQALANLQAMADDQLLGEYGFYEAVDYTAARVPRGLSRVIVRSFMAHHQGMSLLAFAQLLLDRPMQARFMAEPMFNATLLLLQEKPAYASREATPLLDAPLAREPTHESTHARIFRTAATPHPEVQLLSNGRYHVMVSAAGAGYSRWKDLAVTRWREDPARDHYGSFCFIRDLQADDQANGQSDNKGGNFWSIAAQPGGSAPQAYEVVLTDARAEYRRHDGALETYTEIAVSPEDDIELRRVRLHNRGQTTRRLEITTYAEVVLQAQLADELHPAFGNLFVETEFIKERQALVARRRPRAANDPAPRMFHMMNVVGEGAAEISFETDRAQFIGRGRTLANPIALVANGQGGLLDQPLSETQGSVLDPIVSLRRWLTLQPEQVVSINIVFGCAADEAATHELIAKYQDWNLANRVFDLAWTHSQVALRHINASEADAQLYASLASSIIYANPVMRADGAVLAANTRGQANLWPYSISGDLPIVLLRIAEIANVDLVRQLLQAHAYWRQRGLAVDLIILNEDSAGYRQELQDRIMGLAAASSEAQLLDKPGGVFVRVAEQLVPEDRALMQAVARIVLSDRMGGFAEQIELRTRRRPRVRHSVPITLPPVAAEPNELQPSLELANSVGGFSARGREYVIHTRSEYTTPAPWVNVLANEQFGTIVSESGAAYSWSENAQLFRLTPWHNDPVADPSGEAFYIRDEDTGQVWSPMPFPMRGPGSYRTRHGFGYSVFEYATTLLRSEVWVYVDAVEPIKYVTIKLFNTSADTRHLTLYGYVEWVLGDIRSKSMAHVVTEVDADGGALLARNAFNSDFPERIGLFCMSEATHSFTTDRTEFIGRNGSLHAPAGVSRPSWSNRIGGGLDACGALMARIELAAGEQRDVVFVLGSALNINEARARVRKTCGVAVAAAALARSTSQWRSMLDVLQIKTPDMAVNHLVNGWLPYQVFGCRLMARSGFYQSGGAFGFRDQLQDSMALVHARPDWVRAHLLRCAARQFLEGDVQHWWHLPSGRGIRSHCSDDYLWLPLVTAYYVRASGDTSVLDEMVGFIDGPPLADNVESHYDQPWHTPVVASLYEHCQRAIRHGLRMGAHGIPLMGSGDWNDGMNRVGHEGRGESVWLGFFLYQVLQRFGEVSLQRGDHEFAIMCELQAKQLQVNIEQHAWDGAWYRRAYFDNGQPLGSIDNDECRIDSITQSWAVLSGASDPSRAYTAMQAVDDMLIKQEAGLIQLLTPPFDKTANDPGYIKGYVPGIRENGGQYTHAAIWAVMAFAELGEIERAWQLLALINPVNHSVNAAHNDDAMAVYKVEPYVIAADVYAGAHMGRGGWTWYTGSAAWMYRLIIETLLGIRREATHLIVQPRLPAAWPGFSLRYVFGRSVYEIKIARVSAGSTAGLTVDGEPLSSNTVPLVDDGRTHSVMLVL